MEEQKPSLSLEQKVLASATGILAGVGTLWLGNDILDYLYGTNNPYGTIRDAFFNVGTPAVAYALSAASLYLTKFFDDNQTKNKNY